MTKKELAGVISGIIAAFTLLYIIYESLNKTPVESLFPFITTFLIFVAIAGLCLIPTKSNP